MGKLYYGCVINDGKRLWCDEHAKAEPVVVLPGATTALEKRVRDLEKLPWDLYAAVKRAFVVEKDGRHENVIDPGSQVRIKAAMRSVIDAAFPPATCAKCGGAEHRCLRGELHECPHPAPSATTAETAPTKCWQCDKPALAWMKRALAPDIGKAWLRERDELRERVAGLEATLEDTRRILAECSTERDTLLRERDTPELYDFAKAVSLEALHQRSRWGSDHDAGKTDADWFWLIGYLAGKALHNPGGEADKQLHRIITVAAAAANWHAAKLGKTNMRAGIDGDAALTPPAPSDSDGEKGGGNG